MRLTSAVTDGAGRQTRPVTHKQIVFVDDEQRVLDGLRDGLWSQRRCWQMSFFTSGAAALEQIADGGCDVIVSDLLMPGMDGATLLGRVRELVPEAARVVLSGHAELRMIAQAAGVAHQLLAKPCETEQLIRVVDRCCQLRDAVARVELARTATGAAALPTPPQVHLQLSAALTSEDTSIEQIGAIVEQDIGITAKVLQLANSAYFGVGRPVTGIADAVRLLGLETLQALVLQAGAFTQLTVEQEIPGFDLQRLERHCYRVGHLARALLSVGEPSKDAFAAGLLHDIGLLVLAAEQPERLAEILAAARQQRRPIFEVERECCEVTHAEVGAHLLALWNVPLPVAGAVLTHHDPPAADQIHDEITATYVANVLVEELESREDGDSLPPSKLDMTQLQAPGLAARLPQWRALAAGELERLS